MGVPGVWEDFKKKCGLLYLTGDQLTQLLVHKGSPRVQVDLLGSSFVYFRGGNYKKSWRLVLQKLQPILAAGSKLVIKVDNDQVSSEKALTWIKRRKPLIRLSNKISKKKKKSKNKRNDRVYQRVLHKRFEKKYFLNKTRIFAARPQGTDQVTIIQSRFEADVDAGINQEFDDWVFSTDSDLFAYEKSTYVLRFKGDGFELASRPKWLLANGLDSQQGLWLCTLAGNDYARNIPGRTKTLIH
jgi:hypothetical protein